MACAICRLFFLPSLLPHNPRAAAKEEAQVVEKVPHEACDSLKYFKQEKWISLKFGKDIGCSANIVMPSRHFCIAIGTCLATISSGIISGYWMGPDVEDGWGYVEAAVDRIF
ncbi:uncharacterized protein [Typha latifolia]|uniref:uncharacterized protein n=1 Tax=Typha latifolia TaxID=4733 RepID=UPI003C2B04E7